MTDAPILTLASTAAAGSALDPLVEEVTWAAWRLTGAARTDAPGDATALLQHRMRLLAQILWQPGRVSMLTQASRVGDNINVELAIGCLAPRGESAQDLHAAAVSVKSLLFGPSDLPITLSAADPEEVLGRASAHADNTALIRQRMVRIEPLGGEDSVEVLARFNPMPNPWRAIMSLLAAVDSDVVVRATALPTRLDLADRFGIEVSAKHLAAIFNPIGGEVLEDTWDVDKMRAWRAQTTVNDLRESLTTPLYATEIAVASAMRPRSSLLRAIGCAFTSESDVVHRAGHVVVAGQAVLLGGFDVEEQPAGLPEALQTGLPLYGGAGSRELRDLLTLTELPVGLPCPDGGGLPGTEPRLARSRPVPAPLSRGELIGRTPDGTPVRIPGEARSRHALYAGATGSGKSTLAVARSLGDLRAGRSVVFIDPHGDAVRRIHEHVRTEGIRGVKTIGLDSRRSVRWRPFGALPDAEEATTTSRAVTTQIGQFVAAIRAAFPADYTGPRFDQQARAVALLAAAHGVSLRQALSWYGDSAVLPEKAAHPRLPADARNALLRLYRGGPEGATMADWVLSKFSGVLEGRLGELLAAPDEGVNGEELLGSEVSLLVDLSGLPVQDAALFGSVVLAGVLEAAMANRDAEISVYVDEAQRFPVPSMIRMLSEGRKFAASLHLATQSLSSIPDDLADAALAAGTIIAFRQSPNSAARLSQLLGVAPSELVEFPDLTACVKVVPHPSTTVVIDPYEPLPESAPDSAEPESRLGREDESDNSSTVAATTAAPPSQKLLVAWRSYANEEKTPS